MGDTKKTEPGPVPERVKPPHKKWQDDVKEALQKERPGDGWLKDQAESKEAGDQNGVRTRGGT